MTIQHGITITDIYDPWLEGKLKTLKSRPWARLVIDQCVPEYIDAAKMISQYADVVVQVCDSYLDGKLLANEYIERSTWVCNSFDDSMPIEVGNEINGDWCSPNVILRVKSNMHLFSQHRKIVTLYYQPNVIEWWNANKIDGVEVWLSFYPTKFSEFSDIPLVLKYLNAVGLSECGMEEWGHVRWSKITTKDIMMKTKDLAVSVNWWDWQKDWQLWNEVFA